jgi:O-acetyl-ADP-ribose deacetylase
MPMSTILELVKGDITKIRADAIVNAANESLIGGGGVDGAIHAAAGPELLDECEQIGGCETGDAKITKAYLLPARYVIHAVGPVWMEGLEQEWLTLSSAYRRSLEIAEERSVRTITFPSISTGAFGYPVEDAALIALSTIEDFVEDHPDSFDKITMVLYDDETFEVYKTASNGDWEIHEGNEKMD